MVHPEQTNLHGICRDPLADGTFIPDLPILGVMGVVQEYPLVNTQKTDGKITMLFSWVNHRFRSTGPWLQVRIV